jgi:hypothetical protein
MAPLVRRSWAPRGRTPVLMQRGRSRRKVSVIGALVISPKRRRVRGYFRLHPEANLDGPLVLSFVKELLRTLRVPIELVWDRLNAHRGEPVKSFLARERRRLHVHLLPPYAPELNPVELIWGHLKTNPMANFAPTELADLVHQTDLATCVIARDQALLRSFLEHCPLSLRLK